LILFEKDEKGNGNENFVFTGLDDGCKSGRVFRLVYKTSRWELHPLIVLDGSPNAWIVTHDGIMILMKLICALLVISIFPSSGVMALPDDNQSFRGRIIATRQMEGFEFITFVDNREYFLFRTNDNSKDVIKIVRIYRGHNGLPGDYLEGLPLLQIKAVRYA
jgi:hypothetical protein